MSWMAKLYETYEAGLLLTDLPDDKRLMPTSHTLQNAHINIAIDGEGNLVFFFNLDFSTHLEIYF